MRGTPWGVRIHVLLLGVSMGCAGVHHGDEAAAGAVLDDFHAAAAAADESRYFGHFAKDGVFLGTDATERWTVEEFRAYAHPHFAKGRGWTYRPRDRHVAIDGAYAWFDELLDHDTYGELRGTGVLRREAGAWRIVQYNLTFTIPNDKVEAALPAIR